jgi:membrane protein implicated in regulation of membrane protease activity
MMRQTFGREGFWVILALLVVLCLGQGLAMVWLLRVAWQTQTPVGQSLTQVAWLLLILLCLTLLILFWMVVRRWREGILNSSQARKTDYVDVWSEAGRRVQPERDAPGQGDQGRWDSDEPESDGPEDSGPS